MDIKEISSSLKGVSSNRRYMIIEKLILDLLEKHIKEQDKEFLREGFLKNEKRFRFDGYAPGGFDDYGEGTAIEIKMFRPNKAMISRILNIYCKYEEVKNLIIIIAATSISDNEKRNIEEFGKEYTCGKLEKVVIWDAEKINELLDKYKVKVDQDYLEYRYIDSILKNSNNDSQKSQDDIEKKGYIDKIKNAYKSDDLVLFLGSGVSFESGIPTWDKLISELFVSLLANKLEGDEVTLSNNDKQLIVEHLKSDNGNFPLLQTRFIKSGLKDEFLDTLSNLLYKDCLYKSSLMDALCDLCSPKRSRFGIKSVVTYNFDDVLEYNLEQKKIEYKSIYRETDIADKDELEICHVHGFVPKDKQKFDDLDKSLLVFSEEGYHDLISDPYNWANLVQLKHLRENTCLFIGLSMTDPNLRRLLSISMRNCDPSEGKHYVILKKKIASNSEGKFESKENVSKFDEFNHNLQNSYFKDLGLNVVWVDDHNEISEVLNQINK